MRAIKSWWLILAFVSGFAFAMVAEELLVSLRADHLEIAAPRVHFLAAEKPLAHLHNAEAVPFDVQVTLLSGTRSHVFSQLTDQFVVSWDLWEEKFRVSKTQSPMKSASHLTGPAAEQWCFERMSEGLDVARLGKTEPFWVRVEIRAEDSKDGPLFGRGNISESGISLASLIDVFSRAARPQQSHWGPFENGPYTLDGLSEEMKRSRRAF